MTPITETNAKISQIPLSVPEFLGNEWVYLKECLDSGWVSSAGPFVDRFEQEVAQYVGAQHAVATINATAALQIALQVVGVMPGDEVLVSDLTFVAPVNAICYRQARPIFIDADPAIWQMDAGKLEVFLNTECEVRDEICLNKKTGRRVRAILPVHILGLACEMDRIAGLARRFHLKVVEDAAEAMGVRYRGRHVGTFGDVGVFSFNGNKVITSGGGGMLVTDHPSYATYARYLTTQAKDDPLEYLHHEIGYNYRLTNLQAALGCAQLEQLDGFLLKKRQMARQYEEGLNGVDGLTLIPHPAHTEPTYWLYTFLLRSGTSLTQRQTIIQQLHSEGIEVRPLWHPIHGLAPYRHCQKTGIKEAISLYERGVSLPSSVGLEEPQLTRCIAAVRRILEREKG